MTFDIKRILVPLDFSTSSELALDYARAMAQRFGAAVHLVHVCEAPSMIDSMDAYGGSYTEWNQRLADDAERQLSELEKRLPDVRVSTEVLFGNPARCIVTAASVEGSDLIVMGTHGHGAIMHVLMGNVAERVVRTAPCPVLTVRAPRQTERVLARKESSAATICAVGALLFLILLLPAPAPAQGTELTQTVAGGEIYRTYCTACHGGAARGDGPLAGAMARKPADLTEIAKRSGGNYPSELVFRTIDGSKPVRGHGGPDMPKWAEAFARSRDGGDDEKVRRMIQALVDYLESIQTRAVR